MGCQKSKEASEPKKSEMVQPVCSDFDQSYPAEDVQNEPSLPPESVLNPGNNSSQQKVCFFWFTNSSSWVELVDHLTQGNPSDKYQLGEELGRGAFSIVYRVTEKQTQQVFAMKHLSKHFINLNHLPILAREVDIMKKLKHPYCLSLYEIFETEDSISIILEYVSGGELFNRIIEQECFRESDAVVIVKQLLEGVAYLHRNDIVHRDLKPENILCSGEGANIIIKIADFGLSRMCSESEKLMTSCGSVEYGKLCQNWRNNISLSSVKREAEWKERRERENAKKKFF